MKKMIKKSLFIIGFCLLLILLSNSKAQATTKTITTVQELQEIMGATAYSTIEGTTLKITDNFTWTIPSYSDTIDLKIPILTIDFNGKEIKIDQKGLGAINVTNGKVILKDSQGETGGIYCTGHFIDVRFGTELIIENGQYIGESIASLYLFQNNGGTITINNGIFKCMNLHYGLFEICSGKMTINNGTFWGNGTVIGMTGGSENDWVKSELIINGGSFSNEHNPLLNFNVYLSQLNIEINGGEFKSLGSSAIYLSSFYNGYSQSPYKNEIAKLKLNDCKLTGTLAALMTSRDTDRWNINIVNCSMKNTTTDMNTGAISVTYSGECISLIKKLVSNYDSDVFEDLDKNERGETVTSSENTYRELVFQNSKLISATKRPGVDNSENNSGDSSTIPNENEQNKEIGNEGDLGENRTTQGGGTTTEKNDTKLPQTGKETNTFVNWLSIVILLGIFWLSSMLLIEYEKRKMKNK